MKKEHEGKEVRYVQRDEDGKVCGHFSHPHPYAQEEVLEGHPEILAWDAERRKLQTADYKSQSTPRLRAAEGRIKVLEENVEVLRQRLLSDQEIEKRIARLERGG